MAFVTVPFIKDGGYKKPGRNTFYRDKEPIYGTENPLQWKKSVSYQNLLSSLTAFFPRFTRISGRLRIKSVRELISGEGAIYRLEKI